VTLLLSPPSDAQLKYIADLCEERGADFPDAVASKQEASLIISEILNRTYRPEKHAMPFAVLDDVPFL
jgi:hypothetical protein